MNVLMIGLLRPRDSKTKMRLFFFFFFFFVYFCFFASRDAKFPLYPGCRLLGGLSVSEQAVLSELRIMFCNDRLFSGKGEVVDISGGDFAGNKYSCLAQVSKLIGANVRSDCEPNLLRAINTFCSVAGNASGKKCEVVRRREIRWLCFVIFIYTGFSVLFCFCIFVPH